MTWYSDAWFLLFSNGTRSQNSSLIIFYSSTVTVCTVKTASPIRPTVKSQQVNHSSLYSSNIQTWLLWWITKTQHLQVATCNLWWWRHSTFPISLCTYPNIVFVFWTFLSLFTTQLNNHIHNPIKMTAGASPAGETLKYTHRALSSCGSQKLQTYVKKN
jgi:hypothetical protein